MQDILWILALANVTYIAYALRKNKTKSPLSLADAVRVLDVPEEMLSVRPVPKTVQLKDQAEAPQNQWWENKIQGGQGKSSRRKGYDPDQMLLCDVDDTLN